MTRLGRSKPAARRTFLTSYNAFRNGTETALQIVEQSTSPIHGGTRQNASNELQRIQERYDDGSTNCRPVSFRDSRGRVDPNKTPVAKASEMLPDGIRGSPQTQKHPRRVEGPWCFCAFLFPKNRTSTITEGQKHQRFGRGSLVFLVALPGSSTEESFPAAPRTPSQTWDEKPPPDPSGANIFQMEKRYNFT